MNIGPARTKIFVVSLRNAAERRRIFETSNAQNSQHWEFFDAHETLHPDLYYDEDKAIIAKGRPLTRGEIGCYSSHYALWKKLADDDADQYIILEDDVIIDWQYLTKFMAENHQKAGRDYIRLYYKRPVRSRLLQKNFLSRASCLIELTGYCFGTQAYLLTRNGARRFAEQFRQVARPVDDAMDRSWIHGIPNLAVFPFPVIEQSGQSDIGAARFEAFTIPLRLKLRRFAARNFERAQYHVAVNLRLRTRP
jgi:glycosyl transferase, family 25